MAPGRHAAPQTDAPRDTPGATMRVVRGNPDAEELAAITAVLSAAVAEAAEHLVATAEERPPSAWSRTQRPLRSPLTPGRGRWRSFG